VRRVALCKEMDARREAQRVVKTTGKARNDADVPFGRNPLGQSAILELILTSAAATWNAQTDSLAPSDSAASLLRPLASVVPRRKSISIRWGIFPKLRRQIRDGKTQLC
jgi:hypothetical protein